MTNASDPKLPQAQRFRRETPLPLLATRGGLVLAIIGVLIVGALSSPTFLTAGNFLNVLINMSIIGMVVAGMTFVLVVGGLADLSVPATKTL